MLETCRLIYENKLHWLHQVGSSRHCSIRCTATHTSNYNSSFEREEEFKYLGATLTDQNSVREEIKSRLKSGNVCYYSVQNILSSGLLSKNTKIKIYITIILPVVLYGCETWSLTLREKRRMRAFLE
jgi:hypothetical protein